MHHLQLLIFFALLIFAFGLFSRLAERKSITGPMFFMTVGILGSSIGFGFFHVSPELGPRGIASVLYLLMALAAIGIAGYEQVMSIIVLTVAISVYAHGVSAMPLSRRYGQSTLIS